MRCFRCWVACAGRIGPPGLCDLLRRRENLPGLLLLLLGLCQHPQPGCRHDRSRRFDELYPRLPGDLLGGGSLGGALAAGSSAALPLAFMALAAAIGQRHALAAVWMGLTFLFHPVTGINAFGVYLVYEILLCRTLAWRPFLLAVLAVGGLIGGYVFFMGGERHVPLFLDPQWRHVIDDTVGGYVFVAPEIAAKKFWATVIPGLLAVLVTRSPRLTAIYGRFAVAACWPLWCISWRLTWPASSPSSTVVPRGHPLPWWPFRGSDWPR